MKELESTNLGLDSVTNLGLVRALRRCGSLCAIACVCITAWNLIGYFGGWTPGFRVTPTIIVVCLELTLLLGFFSDELSDGRRRVVLALSALAMIVAALTIGEYLSGRMLGVDLPYVGRPYPEIGSTQLRMSPNSALAFFFVSAAAFFQLLPRRVTSLGQSCAIAAFIIAFLAMIGHLYGVSNFYTFSGIATMSQLGSWTFMLFSIATLFLYPAEGVLTLLMSTRAGGSTARKLFIAVVLVPPMLGFFSLAGYNAHLYDTPFGISVLVIMSMIIFAVLTTLLAIRLEDADTQRSNIELELSSSREELRELSGHVQSAQEEERFRIAREIHDELGQALTALKMDLALVRAKVEDDESSTRLDGMNQLVDSTIKTVQRIATALRPGVLDDLGLSAALEWQSKEFQRRTGIVCALTMIPREIVTDKHRSIALFRIFQETLTNVARHAQARKVTIHLKMNLTEILLRISDDGKGISQQSLTRSESLGLIGMRERVTLLGGTIEIAGVEGAGTTVEVVLPLEDRA